VRARGGDAFVVYFVPGIHKIGCSARLEARLREQGIPEHAARILEVIPKSRGARAAAERERFWCELLGCDPGTGYDEMLVRRRRRRRRVA
jgi:hypothetical protein